MSTEIKNEMNNETNNEINKENETENIVQELNDYYNVYNSKSSTYVSSKEKYDDVSSSAMTFFLVGGIGLVLMIIILTNAVDFPFSTSTLFNVVMTTVFIIFIVIGIVSAINASNLKKKINSESDTSAAIKNWIKENISAQSVDALISDEISNEEKYFERINIIKEKVLASEFANVDEAFLDSLLEEAYGEIFE